MSTENQGHQPTNEKVTGAEGLVTDEEREQKQSYQILLDSFRYLLDERPDVLVAIGHRDMLAADGLARLAEHLSTPDGRIYVSVAPVGREGKEWNIRLWSSEPVFFNNHANRNANMLAGTAAPLYAVREAIDQMQKRMRLIKGEKVTNRESTPEHLNAWSYIFERRAEDQEGIE